MKRFFVLLPFILLLLSFPFKVEAQLESCLPGFCPPQRSCATVSSTDTWNPADKSASITLSAGNTVATSINNPGGVRTVGSHTTGKWYFEILTGTWTGNIFDIDGLGFTTGALPLGDIIGNILWIRNDGLVEVNGVSANLIDAIGGGQTIQFAVDLTAKKMWLRNTRHGSIWVGASIGPPSPDPVTGVNGIDMSGIFGAGVAGYPYMTGDNSTTDIATYNQTLTFTPPFGYCPW